MKNKLIFLLLCICISLLTPRAYGNTAINNFPLETISLSLPQNIHGKWKEISRDVDEEYGVVEYIPLNQTVQTWSEAIHIFYFHKKTLPEITSLDNISESFFKDTLPKHEGSKITCGIIERNRYKFTCEWIIRSLDKDVPSQHLLGRWILTKKGLHAIVYTCNNGKINSLERKKWIKLLNSVKVVPFLKASTEPGILSLADSCKYSIILDSFFQDWKVHNEFVSDTGHTLVCMTPPSEQKDYVTECLEIFIKTNGKEISIDQFFNLEKETAQKFSGTKIDFQILKKDPHEIIYSYAGPKDHLILNAVGRIFIKNQKYYSIRYRHGLLNKLLQEDEILDWVEKLDSIRVP